MRLVIGMNGATGSIYGIRLLQVLAGMEGMETHLVLSPAAEKTIELETEFRADDVRKLAHFCYPFDDIGARLASGTFRRDGMIVAPCSMKTLSAVACGFSDNLVTRAADVCLKEKRPCVLLLREMPLSRVHLRNMLAADEAGATIMVASPPFYNRPRTIADLVDGVVARVLDHLGVENDLFPPWGGFDA